MRRLRFIPALLLVLSACSENIIEQKPSGQEGSVTIALSTDMRTDQTKADGEEPKLDDFRMAIYKKPKLVRLYNDSYANTKGKTIPLNCGEYKLIAQHGDTLGCGFDKPYYLAEQEFKVEGRDTEVSAVAKLANVKMSVYYDATFTDVYTDYYVTVKHNTYKNKKVKFTKDETRYGYIPGGELVLEVCSKFEGKWYTYTTEPTRYNPNDFVTFTIATNDADGFLTINVSVDSTIEDKEENITIPAIVVPQDAPSITLAGFDSNDNSHVFIEGVVDGSNAMASFVARGAISNCYLTIESTYLAGKGVPESLDFANLSSEEAAALKGAGFDWDESMLLSRNFSYIDFSDVISLMLANIKATEENVVVAKFGLKVIDSVGKSAETSFSIISGTVWTTINVDNNNVWATKILSPSVSVSSGNMSLLKLQISTDNKNWTNVSVQPQQSEYTHTYDRIDVNPATTYYLRAIYNNNEATASSVVTVTTEEAAQLGNSGFEEYQTVYTEFTPLGGALGGGSYTRTWYLPYASGDTNPWWACNSMESMADKHTGWTSTWCKNFPSSGYVTDSHSGSKAVKLFCVNIGDGNTDGSAVGKNYEGEIWLGTANSDGSKAVMGRAFSSRPSKFAFYYKYEPLDGKTFYIDAWIQDAGGKTIATAKETAGSAASNWTRYELAFNYSDLKAKAAKIYINISSCYGDGSVETGKDFVLGEETVTAHAGCFLTIDDMELIYE